MTTDLLIDLDNTLLRSPKWRARLGYARALVVDLSAEHGTLAASAAVAASVRALESPGEGTNADRVARAAAPWLGMNERSARAALQTASLRAMRSQTARFSPVPGAREFLQWAKQRYRLVLATNPIFDAAVVDWRVQRAGVRGDLFSFVSHADNMHATKPKPEYYTQLLRHIGRHAGACVMIGDSVKKDLPAQAVGVRCLLVDQGFDRVRAWLEQNT